MLLYVLVCVTYSQTQRTSFGSSGHEGDFLTRLNYGVAAVRIKTASVVEGYWTHTFHFRLPDVRESAMSTLSRQANASLCEGRCLQLQGLYRGTDALTAAMRNSIQQLIWKIYKLVPDISRRGSRPMGRQTRGLADFVGSGLSWLFGTATESDIASLPER